MLYTIRKGRHSSGWHFNPYWRKGALRGTAQFTLSCAYDLPGHDQADTNKLMGLSFGLHSCWSARWGWKSRGEDSDTIMLLPYMRERGEIVRPRGRLDVPMGEDVRIAIEREGRVITFRAEYPGADIAIIHEMSGDPPHCGYRLHPYFGGNRTAPHDIHIMLDLA